MTDVESGKIPQADPGAGVRACSAEIESAVLRVVRSGWYLLGPEVAAFEEEFARSMLAGRESADTPLECVSVANGTDALELALRACGVRSGDTVVTVSHTASATVAALRRLGAAPAFVDIEPDTMLLDPDALEALLAAWPAGRQRPTAVVPVHLYGHPCDMTRILAAALRHELIVVEDCAQAHGARFEGRHVGTFGDAAAFSFYPTKNLAAIGDAGAVVTGSAVVAQGVRRLRQYGWRERFVSVDDGVNSRMDEIQAAVLRVRLRHLDEDIEARRRIAGLYDAALRETSAKVVLPCERQGARHAYHQYAVRCRGRGAVAARLDDLGVQTAVHYPVPAHLQPAFAGFAPREPGALAITEDAAGTVLSLPMFPELGAERARRVVAALAASLQE